MKKHQSIKFKITTAAIICFTAGMLVILITMFLYLQSAFSRTTESTFREQGEKYANMIKSQFENPVSFLSGVASVVEAQIASGNTDRKVLQQLVFRAFDKYKISEGTALMFEPDAYDGKDKEYVSSEYGTKQTGRISYYYYRENGKTEWLPQTEDDEQEFVQPYYTTSKQSKTPTFSEPYLYTVGSSTAYMITASYPLMNDGGNVLGIMTVDLYLDSIHNALNSEKIYDTGYITVISEGGSVLYSPNPENIGKDAASAGLNYDRPADGESVRYADVKSVVNGKTSLSATLPVSLGLADSSFYITIVAPKDEINSVYTSLLVVMVAIIIVIAAAIVIVLNRVIGKIVNPLSMMMMFLTQVGETGSLSFTESEWTATRQAIKSNDEIALSLSAFVKILNQFIYYGECLQTVAANDLSLNIKVLSDRDTIGTSIALMIDNMNKLFTDILNTSAEVSKSANHISDESGSLASASAEQTETVKDLSALLQSIAVQTEENSKKASETAFLAVAMRSNADKGSSQMREMTKAVAEINQASRDISKVIKAIDDIAFQTNILALNAAVEAARAGAAGKGFAVVADEVRNLASKSAEAAKNTTELIANSISKAELGAKIAAETSESLDGIVNGINESTLKIEEIAKSGEIQTQAIKRINDTIEQVSRIANQNNATAEQSAASGAELNSQSGLLKNNVAKFKFRQ